MARPVEWRRKTFHFLDASFHSFCFGPLNPGETLVRTVLTFAFYSPVQDQGRGTEVELGYALNAFGTPTNLPSGVAWPLSNPEDYEDPIWWDGCVAETYLYTTAVSPPKEIAMYRPVGGTIDTPVMRTNRGSTPEGIWLQTENGDIAGGATHEGYGYAKYLVKLP